MAEKASRFQRGMTRRRWGEYGRDQLRGNVQGPGLEDIQMGAPQTQSQMTPEQIEEIMQQLSMSPPPPWTQQPQPQMGPPPQMGGRNEFGLPQKGAFGLPSMGGPQMPSMGPPPQSPNVDGTWPMGAPNNLPGAGQSQKKREMLEHFRRMITARRMAAMNP